MSSPINSLNEFKETKSFKVFSFSIRMIPVIFSRTVSNLVLISRFLVSVSLSPSISSISFSSSFMLSSTFFRSSELIERDLNCFSINAPKALRSLRICYIYINQRIIQRHYEFLLL